MAAADEFRRTLLDGLLSDAQKGRGTDLEVMIPAPLGADNDGGGQRTSFHLHHNIVAASSRYFATFPEPKTGRVIEDLDAEAFSVCVHFMYTGEYRERLSHDNVSSVLHAAELLQIDDLKEKCVDFLDQNLGHANHEQVVELADLFNIPRLKECAGQFHCKNSSRDALLRRKESLIRKIDIAEYDEGQSSSRKDRLQNQLKDTEDQLKEVLMVQHSQVLISSWENDMPPESMEDRLKEILMEQHEQLLESGWKYDYEMPKSEGGGDSSTTPFLFGTFKKSGSVGHLVHTIGRYECYYGSSTYYGDEVDESDYEDNSPPPPTEAQYEALGIVKSHGSLNTAIKAAKPGDRIYLAQGVHYSNYEERKIALYKSLEIIGLGKPEDVVFQIDCDDNDEKDQRCISVFEGPVGIYNITFEENRRRVRNDRSCNYSQGSGDNAMISFRASMDDDLVVKNCIFNLGKDCESAYPTRVSGIFLKRGKSATIEGCTFLGGAGSAIVVVNDPHLHIPDIEIAHNNFMRNGQPTFSEKSMNQVFRNNKLEYAPIPSDEVTPGPASLELWRFDRTCNKREKHQTMSIKMTENKFESNLRAPLVYRAIVEKPCWDLKVKNEWKLYDEVPAGNDLKALVEGFELLLADNLFESNGLQFSKEAISNMRNNVGNDEWKECTFPHGDSLLVIKHIISHFDEHSFPEGWGDGDTYDCDEYDPWRYSRTPVLK